MRPLRRTLAWIALLGVGLSCAAMAGAQSFSRQIEGLRVTAADGRESILLTFSAPFEGNPVEEHQAGGFRLRLSATGSQIARDKLFQIRETNSLIQDYRVVQSQYATTVVVNLRDPQLNLEGQLSYDRDGNALRVTLNRPSAARSTADDEVLAQAQQRIGGATGTAQAQAEGGGLGTPDRPLGGAEDEWLGTLLTMVIALVFVLLVLYGLVYLYNRFLSGRLGGASGNLPIRHLGSFAIGPRQRIVVLNINGEVVACGVTPNQISYLTHLSGPSGGARTRARSPAAGGPAAQPESSQSVSGAAPAAPEGPASKDPVHQFAETLREKVRSLKRIK